jgi:hypothetical protein
MTEPIRVAAPSSASALSLVVELASFGQTDLTLGEHGLWEVRLDDDPGRRLADILRVLERWLTLWNMASTTVHIAGEPHELTTVESG